MHGIFLALAVLSSSVAATTSHAKHDGSTGVCYRRISALDSRGIVVNRYETVIVRQSSSVADDIKRVEQFLGRRSPILVPDLTANKWLGVAISDTKFDGTANEDCSRLPRIRTRR